MSTTALIEWGVARGAIPGEPESGDSHVVKAFPMGTLVAVVDGLGHGADAAAAARAATATLEHHAREPVVALIERCHHALTQTRGAVMSLASLNSRTGTMTWIGVGNVEGILLYVDPAGRPARTSLVTRGGIVGRELPPLRAVDVPVSAGNILLFASDGIKAGFADRLPFDASPQQLADQIFASHNKGTDDALVLVARYLGGAGT